MLWENLTVSSKSGAIPQKVQISLIKTCHLLPGVSSGFGSLYFIPNLIPLRDSWITFSAFSISYDPGAGGRMWRIKY